MYNKGDKFIVEIDKCIATEDRDSGIKDVVYGFKDIDNFCVTKEEVDKLMPFQGAVELYKEHTAMEDTYEIGEEIWYCDKKNLGYVILPNYNDGISIVALMHDLACPQVLPKYYCGKTGRRELFVKEVADALVGGSTNEQGN